MPRFRRAPLTARARCDGEVAVTRLAFTNKPSGIHSHASSLRTVADMGATRQPLSWHVNGNKVSRMSAASDPKFNELLAALPADEFEHLRPLLEPVDLALGEVLYESGKRQAYVYFPTDSIVSLVYVMENGASAEVAIAGREGLVGVSLFMGGETTPSRALVQSAGFGFRIRGSLLRKAFDRDAALRQLFLRYTQALLTQMAQTAVCNRHHGVDQQLCRWLLMSIDRLPSNKLVMTQELIANMLGVRRGGVTEAAGKLQDAKAILYRRGRIEVTDRPKLEQMVCECYEVVRKEYARLLPWTTVTKQASSLVSATGATCDHAHTPRVR